MTAQEWQMIETAPKDGTAVLLWGRHCINPCVCTWRDGRYPGWFVLDQDGCIAIQSQSDFHTDYCVFDVPTHWMPLPAPPVSGGVL